MYLHMPQTVSVTPCRDPIASSQARSQGHPSGKPDHPPCQHGIKVSSEGEEAVSLSLIALRLSSFPRHESFVPD